MENVEFSMDAIHVKKSVLLNAYHLNNYAVSFNDVNLELDTIQQRHFNAAGISVLSLRDPFVCYEAGRSNQEQLLSLCQAENTNQIYKMLNDPNELEQLVTISDRNWLFNLIKDAIRYYGERYVFFMLDDEYQHDLKTALGENGRAALLRDLHDLLNNSMVCGSADDAKKELIAFLANHCEPYQTPPEPYLEKYHARFAEFNAALKEAVKTLRRA